MFITGIKKIFKSVPIAASVITGAVFLLPVENAHAVANLNLSTSFTPADAARINGADPSIGLMDSAGTWNGAADVTDVTGDTFTLTVQNTNTAVGDSAFDLDISANIPAGVRLPFPTLNIIGVVTAGGCGNINSIEVTQPGGTGNDLNFNIDPNTNIGPGCTYEFTIGLTTDNAAPFAPTGNQAVVFDLSYNEFDNVGPQINVPATQNILINTGNVATTKRAITLIAGNGQNVDFTVEVLSAGTSGIFDVVLTDTLRPNLTNLSFLPPIRAFDNTTGLPVAVPANSGTGANPITFAYIPTNVRVEVDVRTVAFVNPTDTNCPDMTNEAVALERTGISSTSFATVDFNLTNSLQLTHISTSFCELCRRGTVRLRVENQGGISLQNINLTEDLRASGLTYVNDIANPSQISIDGAPPVNAVGPIVSGANSQILNWTSAQIPELGQLDSPFAGAPPNPVSIEFIFQVERAPGFSEEGLTSAIRQIQPSANYDLICGGISQSTSGLLFELPIRQPEPVVVIEGRNTDAAQAAYDTVVYGHVEDSVIWRVNVQNNISAAGPGDLEDLLIDDAINGNFDINWICNSEAAATNATAIPGGGAAPAGCVSAGPGIRTSVLNFAVDDPFGNPANDENASFIDVTAGSNTFIYYVGRIQASCFRNQINSTNIEWGCENNTPPNPDGGLDEPATTGGALPVFDIDESAVLHAQVLPNGLTIQQFVTGIDGAQPVGSSGLVTIVLTNNTEATIRNIDLTDTLPVEYVVDSTFTPTVVVAPFYGANYLGMTDLVAWDNQDANPLNNIAPHFTFTSSTTRPVTTIAGDDVNLLREGDVLTLQFRVVLIDASRYDLVADLDVTEEVQPATDPDSDFTVNNNVHVNFDNVCGQSGLTVPDSNQNFPADIEDLDVTTSDALFILTNDPGTPLNLQTQITNNGGHTADNFTAYITFGADMTVQTGPGQVPAGCVLSTSPPPHPHWNFPDVIPLSATVYACNRPPILPGATDNITFTVLKSVPATVFDDLTFRADVIGEVTLSDGTALTFPAPASIVNTTPNLQLANNYTLDAVRARVMGFNLSKSAWYCTESGGAQPPITTPRAIPAELNTQIGEDCNYFIESGGWFGFLTPGFTLIAVENVQVTDDLPDGQGFIPFGGSSNYNFVAVPGGVVQNGTSTDFNFSNTANIVLNTAEGGAGTTPLNETDISWNFNATGDGLTIRDEFFRVDVKARLLNDPVDSSAAPNIHAATPTNTARTSFDAIFESALGDTTITVSDTSIPAIPGYPVPAIRQETLDVIEPELTVVKTVCNETLYGMGTACTNFTALANDGDTQDQYIYRIQITNAADGDMTRAPAFDVTATDTLDVLDQMLIVSTGSNDVAPFVTDGLDNDGDGDIDALDLDGESNISDNVLQNLNPAIVTASYTHSAPLLRIDAGDTVTFYYRVNPADSIAPFQLMTNTVDATYDSLFGDFGNQNPPQLNNAAPQTSGRARLYTSPADTAQVRILPLVTQQKAVISVANTAPFSGNVSVGEEIRYRLRAEIPVANLRNFVIRDELPPGLRCTDAQSINLDASPYDAAGFVPGGIIVPSCTDTFVEWDFSVVAGGQELTTANTNNRFIFDAEFIAIVENTTTTQDTCNLRNGGSVAALPVPAPTACSTDPTLARLTYQDEGGGVVTLNYAAIDVVVTEPDITVTKSFAPLTEADAEDRLLVTVTATNNGTATAYNLQILDDLRNTNTIYQAGSFAGTTPPVSNDIVTLGANQPIFEWDVTPGAGLALASGGGSISFTYVVQVDVDVQPHEVLDASNDGSIDTLEARWTSLPNVNSALPDIDTAAARTIQADGNVEGMRNGQLTGLTVPVPSANPPNDYNDSTGASVVVPELVFTKNDIDPATDVLIEAVPTIGEHKKFELIIELPEGITTNVIVTDILDSADVSYILENDATYDVTYSFPGIEFINGAAPSEAAFGVGIADPNDGFPVDESSGTVTWTIGTVDTLSEDDNDAVPNTVSPQIIITYYARINDDINTFVGEDLQNAANVSYINGSDASTENRADNTLPVTVLEPDLTVTKDVFNETALASGGAATDPPDAGDILEYVITIENVGNATAFDTNITDNLPVGVLRDATFIPTATGTGAYPGFEAVPLNTPNSPLIWGRGNTTTLPGGDESLDILAGNTLILTYRVVVQDSVQPNQVLTNTAVIDWTSLNGVNPLERFGTGGADCSGSVAPDVYCISDTATTTVPNLINITKTYTSDTFPPLNVNDLRIGDIVRYTINLELQEGNIRGDQGGTSDRITLVDTIPNGMEFVGVISINSVAGAPNFVNQAPFSHVDIAPPVVTTGGGDNTITWTLGDATGLTNLADNITANDNFTIIYEAQVVDDELPLPVVPADTSTALNNTVVLNYIDVNLAPVASNDFATINALEPLIQLSDVSKVRTTPGVPSGTPITAGPSGSGGDIMDFELSACNSGSAPAYDLILEDILPSEMDEASIRAPGAGLPSVTTPVVTINGNPATQGVEYTYAFVATPIPDSTMRFTFNDINTPLLPGQCIVIMFDIDTDAVPANSSWDNSFQVFEYHSLDSDDVNAGERESYVNIIPTDPVVGPVLFNMNTVEDILPLDKALISPLAPAEAAIGELVTYEITVPNATTGPILYNVNLLDTLPVNLTYQALSATVIGGGYGGTISDITSSGNQVNITFGSEIAAGTQAIIRFNARVNNDLNTNILTAPFGNTATYNFTSTPVPGAPILGLPGSTAVDVTVVEPDLVLQSKTVANITKGGVVPPDAGDILRYTITINAANGIRNSDAFDVDIVDQLSGGLEFCSLVDGGGCADPVVSNGSPISSTPTSITGLITPGGTGTIADPYILNWNSVNASATDIDILQGQSVTITYTVRVLENILPNQVLTNSASIEWTSTDGANINERTGAGGVNDYASGPQTSTITTSDNNSVTKVRISDTSPALNAANDVRIGDLVDYRIRLSLQEGSSNSVVITDILPAGLQFESIVSINSDTASPYVNAAPFSHTDIVTANVDSTTTPGTVVWTLGNIMNSGANDGNNNFDIVYRARVLNLVQTPVNNPASNINLVNNLNFAYTDATAIETASETIRIQQPNLTVSKTVSTEFSDAILVAGEEITYTVNIVNSGQAPAYDIRLEDVIPLGLREGLITMVSAELPVGTPVAMPAPVYDANTGIAIWNLDTTPVSDTYTIPADPIPDNATLRLVYRVLADTGIGAGLNNIVNSATVPVYHSFDNDNVPAGAVTAREIYGPTNTAISPPLATPAPSPLEKANPANLNVNIGLPFTYRITVPDTPQATALYDVRILDNLDNLAPNVDVIFVDVNKISVPGTWVPINVGTPTNIIIADENDAVRGIDIPAGEQVVIDLTVVLRNSSNNVEGDTFTNLASYTYNSVNGNILTVQNGGADSDVPLTIVEPLAMTMEKTGPALMTFGVPGTFTLNAQNIGSGQAFDISLTDVLPKPLTGGGMCDAAPIVIDAEIFEADGTTSASIPLMENTHFITTFDPPDLTNPTFCTFTVIMTAPEAVIGPTQRLIVNYSATLDIDNVNNMTLDNVAATTQWFSGDTPDGVFVGEIRQYNEVISAATPGTPGTLDHEDVFTTTVASPELIIEKNVFNTVTGAPAFTIEPTESVRYEITITNVGPIAATNFSFTDEPDRLNGIGYFDAGSMSNINVSQGGADTSNTDINAGNNAAGILDVRNLNLTELGGANNSLTIDFEMTLEPVIDSGTLVVNQAEVSLAGFSALVSDDPNLPGAIDPTQTIIGSVPTFRLLKTSEDLSGSVTVLESGDILRYTITAQNIGAENAINTLLRDQVPANTTYVANTTTLNDVSIADPAAGISPLQNGILINALEDVTPGAMRANLTSTSNIATIKFDVQIDENAVNSTVISNQAFVGGDGAGSGPFAEQPSDDPSTEIIGDPTRDVVGNVAIIDAQKVVEQVTDIGVIGEVDAGDTLRYTFTINNAGTIEATDVVLRDSVPANTSYVPNSTTMNGEAVADVGGTLPISLGLAVSSADLTPPLPSVGNGRISPMQSSTLVFEVTINPATPNGTVITNQGLVTSAEFPDELTDADGNDVNGDQATEIIVGSTQNLSISKNVFVVGGGTAQPGGILEFIIHVENTGISDIVLPGLEVLKLLDDIDQPNLLNYVPGSARLNGVVDPNIVFNAPRLIVNYDLSRPFNFEPGDQFTVRYLAQIDANAVQGVTINNTAAIDWGTQDIPADNSTAINCSGGSQNVDACSSVGLAVGGAPGVATLSGSIWHDANLNEIQETEEFILTGWEVEIYFGAGSINPGDYLDSVFTDVNGNYSILGLVPNDGDALKYALRFRPPGASSNTASLGTAVSPFFVGNGPQSVEFFELPQSSHIPDINLPIQPNGVAYDSVLRTPVVNAGLQLVNASGTILPASCFVDPAQQNQITTRDGYYKFELNFSQTECAAGAEYTINVFPPAGYFDNDSDPATPNVSAIIPPAASLTDPAFDAVGCANDPIPTTECEVQTSEFAPPPTIAPRTTETDYYQKFVFNSGPGDNQIFNNHIALDPELDSAISITKTSALVNVTRGQLVPYTITLNNTLPAPLYDLDVVDIFPFGFKYINGSGRIQSGNGGYVKVEPVYAQGTVDENNVNRVPESTINNEIDVSQIVGIETTQDYSNEARTLTWGNIGTIEANSTVNIKLLLVVGSGVGEGEYVNRAVARNNQTTGATSLVAQATVRVVPDPTFDCSDVIGKIFDDKNLNAYQDEGEEGIPGVRVLTAKGLEITADSHGRFHLTCAVIPNPDRGSNFIIKLDERSLPSGYRLTTENPRVVRATRGKMVKFNFGAAIHRVVRLDMADAVFEKDSTEMRPQWLPRLDLLMTELAKDPSLLRLSYLAENESESEVNDRLDAVKDEIEKRWEDLNCCYQLMIETEVFWRKGGPVGGEFDE